MFDRSVGQRVSRVSKAQSQHSQLLISPDCTRTAIGGGRVHAKPEVCEKSRRGIDNCSTLESGGEGEGRVATEAALERAADGIGTPFPSRKASAFWVRADGGADDVPRAGKTDGGAADIGFPNFGPGLRFPRVAA